MKKIIIIMAGGLGKRMNSDLPKVLHKISGVPMICKLLQSAYDTNPSKIFIVVGKYRNVIENTISNYITSDLNLLHYVDQPIALGTGHAIQCCMPILNDILHDADRVLILSGDTPLISTQTMNQMFNSFKDYAMVTNYDPLNISSYAKFKDYGKIISDSSNCILKITEKKDCDENELKISCVNCGIYCYNFKLLAECVELISNNNKQNEYYLTDVVEIAKNNNYDIHKFELIQQLQYQIIGVNTPEQLAELEIIATNI